ncbi:hypothetical protein Rhopal_004091-T1 [Rhodotorula paludigena]|uniref:RNI-like protein n=1 Tax=Rhodotorula paludigena TaxID=86838 RepID=A0AAV5GNF2_9BASI|nr:hypothetical protein Rhopal_004091-T1 [Rhodotorula paludigena]
MPSADNAEGQAGDAGPTEEAPLELTADPAAQVGDKDEGPAGDEAREGEPGSTASEGPDEAGQGAEASTDSTLPRSSAPLAAQADAAATSTPSSSSAPPPASAEGPTAQPAEAPSPSPPPPPPRRRHPPAPKKGILRPPQSSHTASSRFSFRRDILQPFNSSYSRAATDAGTTLPSLGASSASASGASAAVAGASSVGEAVGNAAATAGGFFGSALKRLSAAAAGATAVAAESPAPAAAGGGTAGPAAVQAGGVAPSSTSTPATAPFSASAGALSSSTTTLASTASSSPSSAAAAGDASTARPALPVSSLKRVRFRVAALKVVYPINNGTLEPIAPLDEGRTRARVEDEWRARPGGGGRGAEEGVETREEPGIERVKRLLRDNPTTPPKALDLSDEPLSHGAIEALADLLSVDWGCKKLVLERCGIDDESLRPLLHALLVSASIPTVSLAGNKRIRAKGWRYVAVFLRKANFLRYIDLSETSLDKRGADLLVQALAPQPPPAPPLPPPPPPAPSPPPETNGARGEQAKERKGKKVAGPWDDDDDDESEDGAATGEAGAGEPAEPVAEAAGAAGEPTQVGEGDVAQEMEKDQGVKAGEEEGEEADATAREALFQSAPLLKEDGTTGAASVLSLRLENCGIRGPALEALANGIRVSEIKHISLRKNRINAAGAVNLAVIIRDYPLSSDPSSTFSTSPFASSSLFQPSNGSNSSDTASISSFSFEANNSVTARQHRHDQSSTLPTDRNHRALADAPRRGAADELNGAEQHDAPHSAHAEREAWRLSEARVRLRKQLDALPRIGNLLTLDVKGNDIRNGVTYIAQVLKRNRTLKVLNLSENKIDAQGLVAVAEALKFNTTLETLDMGHNPCCGPAIEGILSLRSAMMVSPSLKRVFFNSTDLSSEGAIALAEFLPEARSILHLDLTHNHVDISGVLALAVSIRLNSSIRCLDINIPFDDPDFSRLSRDILEVCVRNTELAQAKADTEAQHAAEQQHGKRVVVAQPIRKSALANNLEARRRAEERAERERQEALRAQKDIFAAAAETRDVVSEMLAVDQAAAAQGEEVAPSEVMRDALVQLQLAEAQLAEATSGRHVQQRERAEVLLSELSSLLDLAKVLYDRPIPVAPVSPIMLASPVASAQQSADSEEPAGADEASAEQVEGDAATGDVADLSSTSPPKPAALDLSAATAPLTPNSSSPASLSGRSPIESESRAMVAEESEVFRKGVALGVDDVPDESDEDDEDAEGKRQSEVSGEELKKEILETTVQRSPRPSFNSDDAHRPSLTRNPSSAVFDDQAAE